ncbi:MAG TPA: membrane protein insertase YidC [Albitalea sp.]|nr:membrane protein insertase YidC [Albitalea sp.]
MTDMRRTLLWGVFLISLFMLYQAWNKHNGQPSLLDPRPAVTAPAPVPAGSAALPGVGAAPAPSVAGAAPVAAAAAPAASAAPQAPNEKVTVTTDVMKATLETRGGEVVRVELLKQTDQNDPTKNVVLLDQSNERLYVAQSGLVPQTAGTSDWHPVMRLAPGERTLKEGANQLELKFESPEFNGVKLVKTYIFKRSDYVVDVKHEVVNGSSAPISPKLYLQLVRDGNSPAGESSFYFTFTGPAIYTDASKFHKIDFKSIEKRKPGEAPDHDLHGNDGWVAMVQHYFTSAWLIDKPNAPPQPREYFSGKVDTNTYSVGMQVPLGEIAPGATKVFDAHLFVGPQEEDKLSALASGLELVKDYGYFKILAKPLFWLLTHLHNIIGNWGWAIVALVVLLKIAFFWLNASAYRSMAKMKAINPKVMEMRERLKDKPQQMQQEMMRIYREEKVNPLGGCLPIFVQMPFFIALYWVLLSSVEMRHAPWLGWITDLSAKDPFYILPLLMTGTSLLQTWLNPTPPDPVQAKMMWIMPLAFSVMFFVFPAGLVLYWLTNNILSIAQQYIINKKLGVLGK